MADVHQSFAGPRSVLTGFLVRRRVALGFVFACVVLWLAQPTWTTWRMGFIVAAVGECVRVWAAGHLEKSREVTRSGPYRWTRHPLYAGSAIMALGVAIASRSPIVAVLVGIYVAATIPAAIRAEEAFLRRTFGATYDLYRQSSAPPLERRFSVARARRNREHRAVLGLVGGFSLLALKIVESI